MLLIIHKVKDIKTMTTFLAKKFNENNRKTAKPLDNSRKKEPTYL